MSDGDDFAEYCAMVYGASCAMSQETRDELAAWELANIDGSTVGTLDWPGWERILGRPRPALSSRASAKKAAISRSLRTAVYERDSYRCRGCGSHIHLSVDHVIPESRGGPTELENLQTLCLSCNISKGVKV